MNIKTKKNILTVREKGKKENAVWIAVTRYGDGVLSNMSSLITSYGKKDNLNNEVLSFIIF